MADNVVNFRRTNPANEERTATDYMFRTIFQQDYYTTATSLVEIQKSLMMLSMWIGNLWRGGIILSLMR
jgi:hypothetical protein